jgi:aspartyl-tRNA(Asn)/glutamyl-tRNA(Gln) amidotransferase subunit A
VGLKPTKGRVSLLGVIPLSWNLDHAGPMARRVFDVALLLEAIAGHESEDPYSPNVPTVDYLSRLGDGVHKWRIAVAEDEFFNDPQILDLEVQEAIYKAVSVFEHLGAEVTQVAFPGPRLLWQAVDHDNAAAFTVNACRNTPNTLGRMS